MTGPEHYREAERELMPDGGCEYGCPHAGCAHEIAHLLRAVAHATLAHAAAIGLTVGDHDDVMAVRAEWHQAAGEPEPLDPFDAKFENDMAADPADREIY